MRSFPAPIHTRQSQQLALLDAISTDRLRLHSLRSLIHREHWFLHNQPDRVVYQ
ncbi:hypothetical protein [Tolypothrix tenuis]|uniref:hypothetical protein n=1 Tax=Tolypothrix tenuis TaxID=457083 RepID=UPI00168462A8